MVRNKTGYGRYEILIKSFLILEDFLIINVLYFVLLKIPEPSYLFTGEYMYLLAFINFGYIISLFFRGIATNVRYMTVGSILRSNTYRIAITLATTVICLFLLKSSEDVSRLFLIIYFFSFGLVLFIFHAFTKKILVYILGSKKNQRDAIILGAGRIGHKLYAELTENTYLGVNVLGFFDDNESITDVPILGKIADAKTYVEKNRIKDIYSTLPLNAKDKIVELLSFSEEHVIQFHIIPTFVHYADVPVYLNRIGNLPVLSVRNIPLSYVHNSFLKKSLDLLFSFLFLVTLYPIIYSILGIIIKVSSPGPIYFMQERTGKDGKNFKCYKFRSMRLNNDSDTKQATEDDDRKTKIGNFIRKTSLDELPQFINVLKGEMSIVGPRPHMQYHTSEYSKVVEKYMVRHFIKPGITGLAQVSGCRGETKELWQMEKRIKKDIHYIENWSLLLDIKIILKTVLLVVKDDKKAY